MNAPAPTQTLQGIEVPTSSIDPQTFFKLCRRQRWLTKTFTYAGLGSTDTLQIQQAGIVYGLIVRFKGQLAVTPSTGSVNSTRRWPYDLPAAVRFSANGQSNLINVSGAKLKAREIMARGSLTDRGVSQSVDGVTVNQGTMSQHNESWGVGQGATAIAAGTYDVDLEWYVPVAMDAVSLIGAIFAQTSATDLRLDLQWAQLADLFTVAAPATADLTGTVIVETLATTIPQAANGQVIVPDLSTFHALTQSRWPGVGTGSNEIRLAGQGVGKQLMRTYWQLWNGTPAKPVAVNADNFGQLGWRFGGNDTPETYYDGSSMALAVERTFDADLSSLQGFGVLDFASENAFRDSVDEGTATELRLLIEIGSGVALASPAVEYVQEILAVGSAV